MQSSQIPKWLRRAALTGAVLCGAGSLHCQTSRPDDQTTNPFKQLTLEELGQIEITTVTREPQPVLKTAAAIFVITQDDIRRLGATSIPEALRMAPGVEVARIDANKWSIGIRGFGSRLSRSVLVLIDGRTVYTTLFDGTYWEVQDTVMADIERIEVIRGPGGTIWGPNAVNGVINIITKAAKDTHGLLVDAGGGNEEQGFADVRYGGSKGNLNYRVYGKGFNRSSEYHTDGQNFDKWSSVQGGFRLDWDKNEQQGFTLQGDVYDETAGERVEINTYSPPLSEDVDGQEHLSGANIMGRWKKVFNEGSDIQIQAYYDRTNRHELNFGELRDTFDVDYLQRHSLPWRQQLTWGLGARFSHAGELQVITGLIFNPSMKTDELFTGFLQDEIALVENRLFLDVGSKVLRTNFTDFEFEPSVRLLWAPSDRQSVWLGFTHAVRTPSDVEDDLFLSHFIGIRQGLPFFARFNGNPNFAPEQMNGYELGYRRAVGQKFYVDVASFYNHYHDLLSEDITGPIVVETDPAPTHLLLPAQFGNGLLGTTAGFEVAPDWRPTKFWRLHGSYSYLHMNLKKAPGSLDIGTAASIAGSSPQHQVLAQSDIDVSKAFSVDVTFRFVSALPGLGVPAYSTADARLGWKLTQHVQLDIVGRNLLQAHHAEFAGEPGPLIQIVRSGFVKLTYTK